MKLQPRTLFTLAVISAILGVGSLILFGYNVLITGTEVFSRSNVGILLSIVVAILTFTAFISEYYRKKKEHTGL